MTARYAIRGTIAPRSQPRRMTVAGAVVEPTREPIAAQLTPLGMAVREACAAVLAGDVEGVREHCPVCDRYGCDCGEWAELMYTDPIEDKLCPRCSRLSCTCASEPFNADPHGDVTWRDSMEVPF